MRPEAFPWMEKAMAQKRELIEPKGDKRYVRRDEQGQFKEEDDVGRSLSQDRKRTARNASSPGQGDKGDRSRGSKSGSSRGSSKSSGSRSSRGRQ
jgi:uncharacterized membrane protein YgcG